MRILSIGHGQMKAPAIYFGEQKWKTEPIKLDINKKHKPDVLADLRQHPLPFKNESFDEIHAYDVLEHLAQQGNYKFFFSEFSEYWRILKPNGLFFASLPGYLSKWAWGDPSHTRTITHDSLPFLSQEEYEKQVGVTAMSDFRDIYKADFVPVFTDNNPDDYFCFILKAIKN